MRKNFSEMLKLQARVHYSREHIKAAALFTRQSFQIEKSGVITNELIDDHRSYVTGAIFAAVSFLEATINEVFADALEHPDSDITANIDPATKLSLANIWKLEHVEKATTLIKYQTALILARKEQLKEGNSPYQDVDTLIIIRNALIHSKPWWERGKETKTNKKILHLQKTDRFLFNPFMIGKTNTFFPDLCLSHGCAEWAVKKSIEFVILFSSRIGSTILFDENSPSLKTQPDPLNPITNPST
jgi:hypothetical protein